LAVLTTNYQGSGGEASHIVSLQVDRLPPRLAHRRLQLDRYLIDSTHSNYARPRISGGPAHAHGTIDAQRPSDPQMWPVQLPLQNVRQAALGGSLCSADPRLSVPGVVDHAFTVGVLMC
jgi:hypothetical protein